MSIYIKLIFSILVAATLAGCNSDSDSSSNSEGVVAIQGIAEFGVTQTAIVTDSDGLPDEADRTYVWTAIDEMGVAEVIAGATGSTYVPTDDEAGKTLTVNVTYTDLEGNQEDLTSRETGVIAARPDNVPGTVTIDGTTFVGDLLTANVDDDNGSTGVITYLWSTGATTETYTIMSADEGTEITVTATYTDDDGYPEAPVSDAVGPVPPENVIGTVAISGNTTVGQILTAEVTDDNGAAGTITYEWFANDETIDGETSRTFQLEGDDVGDEITVTVTYTDDDGYAESATSDPVGPVVTAPNNPGSVVITGTTEVGQVLTATVTDPDNFDPMNVTYEWFADDGMGGGLVTIPGAMSDTYLLTSDEVDDNIGVIATYVDSATNNESPVSATVGPVTALVGNAPGTVEISGTPAEGETLTATVTDSNNFDAMTVAYQWFGDAGLGAGSEAIAMATGETLVLAVTEVGREITVTATYTDDDAFPEAPTSDPVGPVTTGGMFSATVTNGDELLAAAEQAAFYTGGALIELDTATGAGYVDMPELLLDADDMTITLASPLTGADPVITGATCIIFSDDNTNIVLDGLIFDELTIDEASTCFTGGDNSSIIINGDDNTVVNSEFRSDVTPRVGNLVGAPYNFITVSGSNNMIERSLFTGRNVEADTDELDAIEDGFPGAAIVLTVDDSGDNLGNTVQYNLFEDFVAPVTAADTGARVIQIGTSPDADHTFVGNHVVQYNRFDNITAGADLIKVQGSENSVVGNTFDISVGRVNFADGYDNTASNNLFYGTVALSNTFGVQVDPLGHQVTDNYAYNYRRVIGFNYTNLANAGNLSVIANTTDLERTVEIARNTVYGSRASLIFNDCATETYQADLDFDENIILAQDDAAFLSQGRDVVEDEANGAGWAVTPCTANMDFDNNHFFGNTAMMSLGLSASDTFDDLYFFDDVDGNEYDSATVDGEFVDSGFNDIFVGSGDEAGLGADVSVLTFLGDGDVGPNTTTDHVLD